MDQPHQVENIWVHVSFEERAIFSETYGFSGSHGVVNVEGVLMRPVGRPSKTLLVFMHPSSTLQLLPLPRECARMGAHVLCAGSRYARNDTAGMLEKVLIDLGAYIARAKNDWGYEKIVLAGWSGGGSLALFYQAQAEHPAVIQTPVGDVIDLAAAGLLPADAVIFQAAHISRAQLLLDIIDPSVRDENAPDDRITALDIYDPLNANQPPYSSDFMLEYRAAQLARMRRITATVKDTVAQLKARNGAEMERGFVTHRTLADPRFLDGTLDPNDRRIGWCYLGNPETVNSGPVGLGRFSTLRAWLSQWSIDDSLADGRTSAAHISVPFLAIENTADDAVPASHVPTIFNAAASTDKTFLQIKNANHYYIGQPELLVESTSAMLKWLADRDLVDI